jgi:hypothetical protein
MIRITHRQAASVVAPQRPCYNAVILRKRTSSDSVRGGFVMGYEAIFQRVAAEFDLNWYLLMEQAYSESRFDPYAVGPNDELGLLQISQATWGEWAPRVGATEPRDPESNARVASAYLDWIHTRLTRVGRPEWYWTMAAYHWGIWDLLWLVEAGGLWRHVPADHQHYATTIVLAAEADALAAQIQSPLSSVYG